MIKRLDNLKLKITESEDKLFKIAEKSLGTKPKAFKILKKSLDARDKNNIFWVYSIAFSSESEPPKPVPGRVKNPPAVAVIGGGPAGMAAAYYLARMGAEVTIFEKRGRLGGIVSAVIPDFRIDDSVIGKDVSLLERLGVKILTNTWAPNVEELKKEYDDVILAVGAYERG